jgi:raffinose/stachyose/melibiose transport system substrate-binding protein
MLNLARTRAALVVGAAGVAGLAVAVAACGGTNASPSSSGPDKVTLRVVTVGDTPGMAQADAAFEKSHPGISISLSSVPTNDYQANLRTELSAGNGPDVMSVWAGGGNPMAIKELHAANDVASLAGQSWAKSMKVAPQVKQLNSIDGSIYAVTYDLAPAPMAYNQGVLQKYHQAQPTTIPQVLTTCRELSAHGVSMVAIGAATGYVNQQIPTILMDDLIYSSNPGFWSDVLAGKTSFSTSPVFHQAAQQAYQEYAQMKSAGCFNQGALSTTYDQAFGLVASGKALMTSALAGYQDLKSDNPSGSFNTWVLPAGTKPGQAVLTIDTGLTLGVNAHSAHVSQAEQYLQFLAQPAQETSLTANGADLPAVISAGAKPLTLFGGVASYLAKDQVAVYMTGYWTNPQTKLTQEAEGQDLLDGKATAGTAVKAIEATFGS